MRDAATLTAPVVQVRDLQVHFSEDDGVVRAVDGVSFDVVRGRTLGVLGESGCGKSITAKALLRLERPGRIVAGEIRLSGAAGVEDLAALDPAGPRMRAIRGAEIALIFQEPMTSFSPVHSIGDQIVETIRLHAPQSVREARTAAIDQLRRVGMPHPAHVLDQYAWELSGGLRQRAMIAMALSCDPSVLIADEPTTALDVTTQAHVLDLLRGLVAERGMGLMLITHDLGVIAEVADEVLVMYLGVAVESGPVDAIFHAPKHPYTQALLRSMPNVMVAPRTRLATLQGSVPHPQNRPPGCPFHPRCPSAIPGTCDQQAPPRARVGDHHDVSCHLYAPVVARPSAPGTFGA